MKAIAPAMPTGAKYMMMLVNRNITSARLSQKRSMVARLDSCTMASAMPKIIAKTATWRIWPSATLLAKFSGKMWTRKSFQCVGGGAAACEAAGSERESDAGLADVDGEQADDQRESGDDLEVDERLDAHAADALDVAVAGDADDEHGEDERSDDALDEPKEDVGEEAHLHGELRGVEAELRAGDHRDEHPDGEAAAEGSEDKQREDAEDAEGQRRW